MLSRDTAKKVEEWSNRFLTLWSFVPASVAASIVGAFGIQGDFSPFLFLGFSLLTFSTILIAIGLARDTKQRVLSVSGTVIIIIAGILYSLWVQRQTEKKQAREAAKIADLYYLNFAGWAPTIRFEPGKMRPSGLVNTVTIAITFDNPNDFPLYVKSTRRNVSIAGRNSSDQQENVLSYIPPRSKDIRFEDLPITFVPPINITKGLSGTVDFYVCYGRFKERLTKGFAAKGVLRFTPRVDGGLYGPDFRPNDDSPGENGYVKGCS